MNFATQQWEPTAWKDVLIGDIVKVLNDEYFPSDILCLSTTNDEGVCYVETMNLDGETNLKVTKAMEQTWGFSGADVPEDMKIECDLPNNSLYTFTGTVDLPAASKKEPVGPRKHAHLNYGHASLILLACAKLSASPFSP